MENTTCNDESLIAGCTAATLNENERSSDISISDRLDYTDFYGNDENGNFKSVKQSLGNNNSNQYSEMLSRPRNRKKKKTKEMAGASSKEIETPDIFDIIKSRLESKHGKHKKCSPPPEKLILFDSPTDDETDELKIVARLVDQRAEIANTSTTVNKVATGKKTDNCDLNDESDAENGPDIFDIAISRANKEEKEATDSKSTSRNWEKGDIQLTCSDDVDIFQILHTLPLYKQMIEDPRNQTVSSPKGHLSAEVQAKNSSHSSTQMGMSSHPEDDINYPISSNRDSFQLTHDMKTADPLSEHPMADSRCVDDSMIECETVQVLVPVQTSQKQISPVLKSSTMSDNHQIDVTLKKSPVISPAVSSKTSSRKAVNPDETIFKKPRKITRVLTTNKTMNQTPMDLDCSYATRSGRLVKQTVWFLGKSTAAKQLTSKSNRKRKISQSVAEKTDLPQKSETRERKPALPAVKKKLNKAVGRKMAAERDANETNAARGRKEQGKVGRPPKTPTARRLEPETPVMIKNPRKEKTNAKRKRQSNKSSNSTTIRPLYKDIKDQEQVTNMCMSSRSYEVLLSPLRLTPEELEKLQACCLESINDPKSQENSSKTTQSKREARGKAQLRKNNKKPTGGKDIVAVEEKKAKPKKKKRWTKKQKDLLNEMVDEEKNWSTIAEQFKCSEDDCRQVYDSLFVFKTRKKTSSKKVDPKTVQITARVGTIKRRQQVRQKLECLKKPAADNQDMFADDPEMFAENLPGFDDMLSDGVTPRTPSSRLPGFVMTDFKTPPHFKNPSQGNSDDLFYRTPINTVTPAHLKRSTEMDFLNDRKQADLVAVKMGKKIKIPWKSPSKQKFPRRNEKGKTKKKPLYNCKSIFTQGEEEKHSDLDSSEEQDFYFDTSIQN